MFVVAPVQRKHVDNTWTGTYPVVFEDTDQASTTGPIAIRDDRDQAQKLADKLNAALES